MKRTAQAAALVGGISVLAAGVWAFADPGSFYDKLAAFPPYNRHFIHDLGAFQSGIGVTLLIALRWRDALLVALSGAAAGSFLHFVAHVEDRNLGGKASDPVLLGLLAAFLAFGAVARALTLARNDGGE